MQNNTMRAVGEQIPLDLPHRPAYGRDDFLIGDANKDAIAWLDRWPDWNAPALVLHGAAASGKSHLAAVWAEQSKAQILSAELLSSKTADDIASLSTHLVLENVDVWIGDQEAETVLFHLYNMFREAGRFLVLTMRMPLNDIDFALPDLASRLRAAPVATIHPPEDDLLSAILIKLFHDRQIAVSQDVITYILPRMERSFVAAHDLVERADRLALSQKRAVTVPVMREILTTQ